MGGTDALIFVNNHDNQRGHGGGGTVVTFEEPDGKLLCPHFKKLLQVHFNLQN